MRELITNGVNQTCSGVSQSVLTSMEVEGSFLGFIRMSWTPNSVAGEAAGELDSEHLIGWEAGLETG